MNLLLILLLLQTCIDSFYDDAKSQCDDCLDMSKDRILQLLSSIPAMNERLDNLEYKNSCLESENLHLKTKYDDLENRHNLLQSDHDILKTNFATSNDNFLKRFNKGEQYTRRNCLLVNKLLKVPTNIHGWKFSRYIARELNKLFPSISVSYSDIDTSHILYKDEEKKPVIVVKFVNRDLRNLLWSNRLQINSAHVFLSEHLTPLNSNLFSKAKDI